MPTSALPRLADGPYTGKGRHRPGIRSMPIEPYRKLRPDEPPAIADDHIENHLLSEENRQAQGRAPTLRGGAEGGGQGARAVPQIDRRFGPK